MGVHCPDLHSAASSSPPDFCRAFLAWAILHQPGQEKAREGVRVGVPADGQESHNQASRALRGGFPRTGRAPHEARA